MTIRIEYRDKTGKIINMTKNISILALVKYMAIAGQGHRPGLRKFGRMVGMFFHFMDFLDLNCIRRSFFCTPPSSLYDPTEKGQFSNIVGKAIADFLAKEIGQAAITFNYEAAMKEKNYKIKGGRPDLIAFSNTQKQFAIEAKGFSANSVSASRMDKYKNQFQKGREKINVDYTVACVTYGIYNAIKVKYYDPESENEKFNQYLFNALSKEYYSGVMEYMSGNLFKKSEFTFENRQYNKLTYNIPQSHLESIIPFSTFSIVPEISIVLDKEIERFAKFGLDDLHLPYVDKEGIFIDRDGIGLIIEGAKKNLSIGGLNNASSESKIKKNSITNKKLSGLCEWAEYHGFSLLFDNSGNSFKEMTGGMLKINCLNSDPKLEFYALLKEALSEIKPLMPGKGDLFCPLPLFSYHVTVWDGVNDGNVGKIKPVYIRVFQNYLHGFPDSFQIEQKFHSLINHFPFVAAPDWDITFKFNKLENWGNNVLVARLMPSDDASKKKLHNIKEKRIALTVKFKEKYGDCFSDHWKKYSPHVSLGYFANKDYGSQTAGLINGWTDSFRKKLRDCSITFLDISLYGFKNMATLFKCT